MKPNLDDLLRSLRAQPADRSLDQLEPAVWRRIATARQPREAPSVFIPLRTAAVIGALGLGVAVGGAYATETEAARQEISAFEIGPSLAPSTLLEGR